MASPQTEDGYTKIANELLDALIAYRLPGEQRQCLDVIFRKTYGYQKKQDAISLSQFVNMTGLKKPAVCRAIAGLLSKKIITIIKKDNAPAHVYEIVKDFTTWEPLSKKITLSKKIINVNKKDNPSLSKKSTTKENTTKERKKEGEKVSPYTSFVEKFNEYATKEFGKTAPKQSKKQIEASETTIKRLVEIDNFTFEYVQDVLRWVAKKDVWWHDKVKSLAGLRKAKDDGLTKFQKIASDYDASKNNNDGVKTFNHGHGEIVM